MSVSLSFGIRNAVNSLTDITDAISRSNQRLATGKKVNSALDNANAYFQANGFRTDATNLETLQSGFDAGLKTLDKAVKAIEAGKKLIDSAQGLARQARALGSTDPNRDTFGTQIAELVSQASKLFTDAGYNGKNLLVAANAAPVAADNSVIATNLNTGVTQTNVTLTATDFRFNPAPSATSLYGNTAIYQFTAANTGVTAAVSGGAGQAEVTTYAAATGFAVAGGDTKLDNLINSLGAISSNLSARGSVLATASTTLQVRNEFTSSTRRILNSAADNLTLADINEEGAILTTLQTRQQLSVTALSLAGRSDQAILRLF
jgi:flagellin